MAFVPSSSFFQVCIRQEQPKATIVTTGHSSSLHRCRRLYVPPTNTLVPIPAAPIGSEVASEEVLEAPQEEVKPESAGVPVTEEEMTGETYSGSVMQKALAGNFAEFHIKKPTESKPRPKKNCENFVKLNMSKGRSFSKMGKTRYSKFAHRKPMYKTIQQLTEDVPLQCFSKGFYEERPRPQLSLEELRKKEFCYEAWEDQQLESIEAVLAGKSSLVLLPTGAGKSLIYQVCARMLGGLTIVVFPLVSLIADQLSHLPVCLAAGGIHSSQPFTDTMKVISAARAGKLDLLFTTPEKLTFFLAVPLKNISLLCVDEAHCISEWSHAFRSAYYDILIFIEKHRISRVLALTATATAKTITDIQRKLDTCTLFEHGVRFQPNIKVTCSREDDVTAAATDLIMSRGTQSGSILVFAAYQSQAQSLSDWLKARGIKAGCYHGKLSEDYKIKVQKDFADGVIRVLVTTLAFGMGIDKADVRGVVHLSFPKSIEQYIQEAGRGGRDGLACWSHVFVQSSQYYTMQSYIIMNHVTSRMVKTLIRSIHGPENYEKRARDLTGGSEALLMACFEIQEIVEELGVEKDTIRMIMALLERKGVVTHVANSFLHGVLRFHRKPAEEVGKQVAAVSQVLATGRCSGGAWSFSVPLVARELQLSLIEVVQAFKRLEYTGDISLDLKREAMCFRLLKGIGDDELPLISKEIADVCKDIEVMEIFKLQTAFQLVYGNSANTFSSAVDTREAVATYINEYYQDPETQLWPGTPVPEDVFEHCSQVVGDFTCSPDEKDVACVLMGVKTKKVTVESWRGHTLWRKYSECNFFDVLQSAESFLRNELKPSNDHKRLKPSQ